MAATAPSLGPKAWAKLETIAKARGVSAVEALHQLIDSAAGCGRLDPSSPRYQALSSKQKRVLEHLKSGLSVKEIASEMQVSEQTIRTHIHRARNILGCTDILSLRFQ
jgi:DNA-binding NarL/FixJ family response regulator